MSEVELEAAKSRKPRRSGLDKLKTFLDIYLRRASGVKRDENGEEDSPAISCCTSISVVLTLIMIGYAYKKQEECDAEPMIPTFLMTLGGVWLLGAIIEFARRNYKGKSAIPTIEQEIEEEVVEVTKIEKTYTPSGFPFPIAFFYILLRVFLAIWFIFGCYWVLSAFPNRHYCDWWIYHAALGYLIFSLFVLFSGVCCFCLLKSAL